MAPIDAGTTELDVFHSLREVHLWRKTLKNPVALKPTTWEET